MALNFIDVSILHSADRHDLGGFAADASRAWNMPACVAAFAAQEQETKAPTAKRFNIRRLSNFPSC